MTQKDQVIVAMEKNGGYATLQQLNRIIVQVGEQKLQMQQLGELYRKIKNFLK